MKLFIATPAYDSKVNSLYAQSLLVAGQHCFANGIQCASIILGNGAFIEVARNVLVKRFLETDFTHLMFIDADIGFGENYLTELVKANLPISAGAYRQRDVEEKYALTPEGQENGGWLSMSRIGTGFMCIRRDVAEIMSERAPKVRRSSMDSTEMLPWVFRTQQEGRFLGEDICFCDSYMQLYREGVFDQPIWVWPNMDLDHAGYKGNYLAYTQRNQHRDTGAL
jgi:hypothetical protein